VRYKVDIRFAGTATVEVEATGPDQARTMVGEMTLADLARPGAIHVLQFDLATRDVVVVGGGDYGEDGESGSNRPRPSGWYRPA